MKVPRGDTTRTRGKLLAAAGEIFAEKGFRDATIAEICRQAGTNIAAVNYHFGSKEALYREAWRHVFSESLQAHPPEGGVPATAPPEERLRGQVTALLLRMADRNNRAFGFLHRELANRTGLLEEVIREQLQPLQQRTKQLIRELLGPAADEQEVRFCEMAIIGQCMNPMVVRGELGQQKEGKDSPRSINDIETYARRVAAFSLAGIASVRQEAGARQAKGKDEVPRKGNRT
jgi:AcrR family transcriptional regulator